MAESERKVHELLDDFGISEQESLEGCPFKYGEKNRVNILALGDVGSTVLMGLRLLGENCISEIGICDINEKNCRRLEQEINQIDFPFDGHSLPHVSIVEEKNLFNCDVFLFCASKGVPPVESGAQLDVRMAQLDANRELIRYYGQLAKDQKFRGLIGVISDPVDPLCCEFKRATGIGASHIQGFGLGVMNTRAKYFSRKDPRFAMYLSEGRAFGPHGADLVIANSVNMYDDVLSRELTELTVSANVKVRNEGYKPYIAPAMSSAAISVIMALEGNWHYGSVYIGSEERGAFLGIKNRFTARGIEYEDLQLPDGLYNRIRVAYGNLLNI